MRSSKTLLLVLAASLVVGAGCSSTKRDEAIATDLKAKMFSNPQLRDANLQVTVTKGEATLTGTVPSDAARYEAFKLATETQGVSKVNDQMTVQVVHVTPARPAPEPAPEPAPTPKKHKELKRVMPARKEEAPPPPPPPTGRTEPTLSGTWLAYLQGFSGALRVSIQQTGDRVVGTIVGGNPSLTAYLPVGTMMFYGTYGSGAFGAQEICAGLNYTSPYWNPVTFKVIDNDHLQEDLAGGRGCSGFPVVWERVHDSAASSSPASATVQKPPTGCLTTPSPQSSAWARVSVVIPAGTIIPIRMIDSIDSSRNHVGEQFAASVDAPVVVGDHVPIEKGADAWVQLVQAQRCCGP